MALRHVLRDIMRVMAEELELPRRWIVPVPVLTPQPQFVLDSVRHPAQPQNRQAFSRRIEEPSRLPGQPHSSADSATSAEREEKRSAPRSQR